MHSYFGFSYMIKRVIIFGFGLFALLLFVTDITWDNGKGYLQDFAVPLIIGVLVNVSLPKIGKENLITPLGIGLFFIAFGFAQGSAEHTFLMGASMMIFFLNSIRPWNT